MNSSSLVEVAIPAVLILVATFFVFIALKTLIGRRPLIISSRWDFALMCLGFLPINLEILLKLSSSLSDLSMISWLNLMIFIVFIIMTWKQTKGYSAYAASDTYFREALLASASSLGFSIEETESRFKIKQTGQEIQVEIQGWMGTSRLKSTSKDSDETVKKIVEGMNYYFKCTLGKMNLMTSYFQLIIGILMMVMAVWSLTNKLQIFGSE